MMIKIVNGYYGHRNGRIVELKDTNSPAFDLEESEARRIIGLGIAKAVDSVSVSENEPNAQEYCESDSDVATGSLSADELSELPYQKLKQICKERGIPADGRKEELIAKLTAADEELQDDHEEETVEEGAPELMPAEPEE